MLLLEMFIQKQPRHYSPKITTSTGTVKNSRKTSPNPAFLSKPVSPHKSHLNLGEATVTTGMDEKGQIPVLLHF